MDTPHGSGPGKKAHSVQSSASVAANDADRRVDNSSVPEPREAIWSRLEAQIAWFDARSVRNKRTFQLLKYAEIAAAAAIPIVTGLEVPREVAAILGGLVVVIESVLHLNQYHQNWITYRSTAEALKQERIFYLAHAGPYARSRSPARLAHHVEAIISQGHARWVRDVEEGGAPTEETAT